MNPICAYLKLKISDVDFFCRDINTLKSKVEVENRNKKLNAKSLLCLLSLDLNEELKFTIYQNDLKELNAFTQIVKRYGGTVE